MKELEKYPKVKVAFEKWYYINYGGGFSLSDVGFFYTFPFSMQWGVWVDFCDSIEVKIIIGTGFSGYLFNYRLSTSGYQDEFDNEIKTRPEARWEAFKQSLTILNDKI